MILSIKVRNLDIKKYNIYKYIIILIYILNNNNKIAFIRREIYIVHNLLTKAFIKINIIKPKIIILDINKGFININFYNIFQILIFTIIKDSRIKIIIINKKRFTILTYFFNNNNRNY